ncbi:MAG TPA: ATP-binding protein [Symbiobacteriaceae bacterium]
MPGFEWLWGSGAAVLAGIVSRRLAAGRTREGLQTDGPEQAGGTESVPVTESVPNPARPDSAPGERGAIDPSWVARHLAWLEEREAERGHRRDVLLEAMQGAASDLALCAEIAGAQPALQVLLDRALDKLNLALREARGERSPLGSGPLDGNDLKQGLERLATAVRDSSRLTVESRVDESIRGQLTPAAAAHVLYVVREALTNAVRHAGASRLALRAAAANGRLVVSIADDGKGFEPAGSCPVARQGFWQMRVRAEAARGLLQVESAPGAGTIVTLTVLLPEQLRTLL